MSDATIDKILKAALADPMKLQEMAVEALYRARSIFNCKNKVDKLLAAVARFQDGERGYWFPEGYSATCRSYSTARGFKKDNYPPWCVQNGKYDGGSTQGASRKS
jgi:hypothetical protein